MIKTLKITLLCIGFLVAFNVTHASLTPGCLLDGGVFGQWKSIFDGYGCVKTVTLNGENILYATPQIVTAPNQTSASLVVGPTLTSPFTFQEKLKTTKQLRVGSKPNAWETAWFIWNYKDNQRFYYFIPKPNGWELGKRDPAYPGGQRFLATGSLPVFPIGTWYTFKVTYNTDNTMSVYINNALITQFKDTLSPYTSGKIGLYTEDAEVNFSSISTTNVSNPNSNTPFTQVPFPLTK